MLNMGFIDDINQILSHVPEDRRMLMFSATMPKEVAKIANKFMQSPMEIVVGTRNEGAENVRHIYYMVNARDKYLALKRVADNSPNIYAIIFCRHSHICATCRVPLCGGLFLIVAGMLSPCSCLFLTCVQAFHL